MTVAERKQAKAVDSEITVEQDDVWLAESGVRPPLSETERLLRAEVEDLKHIHSLSLRLAEADTLAEALLDVVRTAAQRVDARLGLVRLLTPDGRLSTIGQIGFGNSIMNRFAVVSPDDCSTCAAALKHRSRVSVADLRKNRDFVEIAALLVSYGAVGAVSTPVLDQAGHVLAMFSVYWIERHEPDERELRMLDLCAELAGRHVERSIAARALGDSDQRQALLMRELAHRGKHLLSVIQAIATHSLYGGRTLYEAREALTGRLRALSNGYNALADEAAESLQLRNIVTAALRSHDERTKIEGPVIFVPARRAQTLALVIHELTTNAVKYGALSTPSGRITVTWEISRTGSDDERFSLRWSESGGPPIDPPTRQGFGSVIMTTVVGNELNCEPTMQYRKRGIQYQFECMLRALLDRGT